jgi:hypothetical protein
MSDMSERNAAENPKDDCIDARGGQCKVGGTILHRNRNIYNTDEVYDI